MDYRVLLAAPLAAVAMTASSADALRQPTGWFPGASFTWPTSLSYEAGVAPETEHAAERALTVKAIGSHKIRDVGSIAQITGGYAGKRVRFSAQVMASGTDGWAGLVVGEGFVPLYLQAATTDEVKTPAFGSPACAQWCDVSVVTDISADGTGFAAVGLALMGNGQVWARRFRLEVVGQDVPLTSHRFVVEQDAVARAQVQAWQKARAAKQAPLQNLSLE
jgi:hypothetical protein